MAGDEPSPGPSTLPRVGSYDLIQPLGSGGMSSVYRARHVETGLEVAIKILPRTLAKNPTVLQRFLREAKSAEALEHPNIVAIYDRGIDQGRYYLVLEYVAGGDLHDRVRANGPFPIDEALGIVRSIAEALRYAASKGLIHRDIKPANLLLDEHNQVKVADLGLALHAEDEDERVTREGTTVGTVDYMAPEQARDSRATSIRSDIYSLGCTLVFLLTGQPPFPGGDVAEKLNRHINAPPPDIRERRSEVSPALAKLIQRMLAKKPENRFATYDDLIAALDRLAAGDAAAGPDPSTSNSGSEPALTVLIADDDEDDDDAIELVAVEPVPEPAPARPNYDDRPRGKTRLPRSPAARTPHDATGDAPLPLADLLPLDGEEQRSLPAPRGKQAPALNRPGMAEPPEILPDLVPLDEDEAEDDDGPAYVPVGTKNHSLPATTSVGSGRRMSESERSWITTCVVLGLALIVLVIVVDQVFRASQNPGTDAVETAEVAPGEESSEPVVPGGPIPGASTPAPVPTPAATPPRLTTPKVAGPRPARPPWTEPTDPPVDDVAEAGVAAEVEARYVPEWATAAPRVAARTIVVRRVPDAAQPDERASLRAGLEVAGAGTIEVADNGAFFENELRIAADGRWIKARPGYRPIVTLLPPRAEAGQQNTAWLDLGDRSLTLEGIDLIIDVSSLRPTQTTLFAVRGGTLVLRDCTLTVVNRLGATGLRGYTLVKTAPGTKPSRVAFDRTCVRGAYTTAVDLSGGPAEVALVRSVVLNGQGTLATFSAPPAAPGAVRRLTVARSLALTWGPAVELTDTPRGARPRPVTIQALSSTFAHFQSPQGASFLLGRAEAASGPELVEWTGQDNTFAGWSSWLSSGTSSPFRLANLAAARAAWPGSEAGSDESSRSWPQLPPSPDRVPLRALRPLAPNRRALLARVASPPAWLHARTVEEFSRPDVPRLASAGGASTAPVATPGAPAAAPARPAAPGVTTKMDPRMPGYQSGVSAGFGGAVPSSAAEGGGYPGPGRMGGGGAAGATPTSAPETLGTATPLPGTRELDFDADAPATRGDLGLFLMEKAQPGDTLLRVRTKGTGTYPWSPTRLPDGVSLEVVVEPGPNGALPSWTAASGAQGEALIDVRHGHLLLSNVHLARGGGAGLKHLIRVEGGHLGLHRCRLRAPGQVESGGGGLLAFVTPGTGPLPSRPGGSFWPFDRLVERPTLRMVESILQTGGEAVAAEVGHGLVALSQCVVIAGTNALNLKPGQVARARLDADTWLDHCTLAAESAFVAFGRWRGTDPGPDRPWVVFTSDCAFFGQFERSENDPTSVLLRADPEGLAHGAVVWQSLSDALEVPCFLATSDATPAAGRKPDVRSQWVAFWGEHHARNIVGPRGPTGQSARRPVAARLEPGSVEPGDLAVDPDYPPGRPPDALGADLARLGISPTRGARRRPGP